MSAPQRSSGARGRPFAAIAAAAAALVLLSSLGGLRAGAQTARLSFVPLVDSAAFPANLAVAPDGRLFYAEKDTGRIRIVDRSGRLLARPFATVPVDASTGEMGLLGLALHPRLAAGPWVYVYFSGTDGRNHLARVPATGDVGGASQNLLTLLPTVNGYHNGGDLEFGGDGTLFVSVGEGHVGERAQDRSSPGGKILRVNDDGTIPADNPFGASPVYALGIRNSFGLCVGDDGALWETENGPTEWDELNRIRAGANYGWPEHLGPGAADGFAPPVFAWREVVVPTGCVVNPDGSLYVGDFHGDLHRIAFPKGSATTDVVVASFDAGVTDVERTPQGRLLVATANAIYAATTAAPSRGPFTPAGIVVLLVLVGLLLFARRRLERR